MINTFFDQQHSFVLEKYNDKWLIGWVMWRVSNVFWVHGMVTPEKQGDIAINKLPKCALALFVVVIITYGESWLCYTNSN